jgi:LacI family transcriptional regulator, galactose operon repressor
MPLGRPTINDVARRAGVSPSTVSHALSGRRPTSIRAQQRVRAVAEAMGYRPSLTAQSLITGRSLMLGLVVPDLHNPFYAEVAAGVEEAAAGSGFSVIICNTDMRFEKEDRFLQLLEQHGVDGIIFITDARPRQPELQRLAERGCPVIVVDEAVEGRFHVVSVDNEGGGRFAAAHLVELGHRHLAVVAGPLNLPTTRARLRGFSNTIRASGIDLGPANIRYADDRIEGGHNTALQLLDKDPSPTALFATNDLMALGALKAASHLGLRVPQDLSLVGFDDIPYVSLVNPPLTTVAQPARNLGGTAAGLLLEIMEKDPGYVRRIELPVELRVRESTGPCQ